MRIITLEVILRTTKEKKAAVVQRLEFQFVILKVSGSSPDCRR